MLNFKLQYMNSKFKYLFLLAALLFIYNACVKKKTYSQNPEIEYKTFTPYLYPNGDSAIMVIGFADGNGDIGKDVGDTTLNLFMTYYYKDSITQKYMAYYDPFFSDTVRNGYTIRKPNDSYNGKPISGEVSVRINKYRHSKKIKDLKYIIYMFDNAGNKSNILSTPVLIVP